MFVVFDPKGGAWNEVVAHIPTQTVDSGDSKCGYSLAVSGELVFVAYTTDKYDTQSTQHSGVVYVYQVAFGGEFGFVFLHAHIGYIFFNEIINMFMCNC